MIAGNLPLGNGAADERGLTNDTGREDVDGARDNAEDVGGTGSLFRTIAPDLESLLEAAELPGPTGSEKLGRQRTQLQKVCASVHQFLHETMRLGQHRG